MARIDKGNDLSSPVLQPGWTVQQDGYGLWTGRCTYKLDQDYAVVIAEFERGLPHPIAPFDTFMYSNKVSAVYGSNGISVLTVEYVGINSDTGGTTYTEPNVSGAVSTTTESIETHPNFFEAVIGPSFIAGNGSGSVGAPIYEPSTLKAKLSDTGTLYKGARGAHFTQRTGGQFVGFLDPAYKEYYGRKSYLAPTTGFSGVLYTSSTAYIAALRDAVGRSSKDNNWNGNVPPLLPSYVGSTFLSPPSTNYASGLPQLLLASVSFEDFGLNTYKVNYTIRYNREGYVLEVYPAYY